MAPTTRAVIVFMEKTSYGSARCGSPRQGARAGKRRARGLGFKTKAKRRHDIPLCADCWCRRPRRIQRWASVSGFRGAPKCPESPQKGNVDIFLGGKQISALAARLWWALNADQGGEKSRLDMSIISAQTCGCEGWGSIRAGERAETAAIGRFDRQTQNGSDGRQ